MNYPALPKSYKGVYPFKLSTTSFIYPDHILPNVEMLAPYVDEIELLLFESTAPDSLPPQAVIKRLVALGAEFDLTYNVHLPIDISLTAKEATARLLAVQTIQRIIELTSALSPSTYTLHLPFEEVDRNAETVKQWQERVYQSMTLLVSADVPSETISVETLDYPFEWVDPLLNDLNLMVCLDLGHLMVHGFDCRTAFDTYGSRTSIMHLHGVEQTRDHLALNRLAENETAAVIDILQQFTGVLSLEVFSYKHLLPSLQYLENIWQEGNQKG